MADRVNVNDRVREGDVVVWEVVTGVVVREVVLRSILNSVVYE